MIKTFKKLMLVGLLAISGALNAAQPQVVDPAIVGVAAIAGAAAGVAAGGIIAPQIAAQQAANAAQQQAAAAQVQSNNSSSEYSFKHVGFMAAIGLGAWLGRDLYDYCKGHFNGDSAKKALKDAADAIDKEIEIEGKKITLAQNEATSLANQYNTLVLLFNGGNNTGLDKKEIQAEIKKIWEAMKTSSSDSAVVIKTAKDRIKELEQKRIGILAKANAPQTLAQAAQLPTATKQATPEMAAQMLAASRARAA